MRPPAKVGLAALLALAACGGDDAAAPDAGEPGVGTWSTMSDVGAPAGRADATGVWTGSELIVWGGVDATGWRDDGAAYDPVLDRWRPIGAEGAPGARSFHSAVWTGSEVLIWGGAGPGLATFDDGAAYAPTTDTWRPLATEGALSPRADAATAWTGSEWVITGGIADYRGGVRLAEGGAAYAPATDTWRTLASAGQPPAGAFLRAAWSGEKVLYWGYLDQDPLGASYDPLADAWASIDATGAPSVVNWNVFWTGTELLVWGESRRRAEGLGGRWTPGAAAWTPMTNAVGEESYAAVYSTAVWTGHELVVWGGSTSHALAEGFVYDAAQDAWRPTAAVSPEEGRTRHAAVWTGTEMLVWGGFRPDDGAFLATGLRYRPGGAASP